MGDAIQTDPLSLRRLAMVEEQLRARGIRDERVLAAMARVPRHHFVPAESQHEAYGDHPVPIGFGQTISQPYIVAAMLEALDVRSQDRVLEVGAGSGYQTALLAELAARVVAVERYALLTERARQAVEALGYTNVRLVTGDGSQGFAEEAPFDAIIVAAAAPRVPSPLVEQMSEGGRMILPVGLPDAQELQLLRKHAGRVEVTRLDPCRFVPLLGSAAFPPG